MTILDAIDSGAYDAAIILTLLFVCSALIVRLVEGDRS